MSTAAVEFHHVGLLTDQPETAVRRLARAGYQAGPTVFDPLQLATLQMCTCQGGASSIEIVTPAKGNQALGRLLSRRGDYMYHACFTTPALQDGLATLADGDSDRIVVVSPPKPAVLFNNALVAFYLVPGLGLIELLERQ